MSRMSTVSLVSACRVLQIQNPPMHIIQAAKFLQSNFFLRTLAIPHENKSSIIMCFYHSFAISKGVFSF